MMNQDGRNQPGKELSPRQKKVIAALLNARTIEEALQATQTSRNTLWTWLKQDSFKSELKRQQDAVFEAAAETVKLNIVRAADVLCALLDSKNEALKRAVANDILGHMFKFRDTQDIETRLTVLEQAVLKQKVR